MSGKIVYKDVAPQAAQDATFSAEDKENFSTLLLNDVETPQRPIALEQNRWLLDGSFVSHGPVHFWSRSLSGADCAFSEPPLIDITFTQQHSSVGISLVFDEATGEYCRTVTIAWYQTGAMKSKKRFAVDSVQFFCENIVEAFDRVVITLEETNLPHRRARLSQIIFGLERTFRMNELTSANAVMQTDPSSASLPAGKLSWTLRINGGDNFLFQSGQPVEAYAAEQMIGAFYVNSFDHFAAGGYQVIAQDAIGVLGEQPFEGGAYLHGVGAKSLVFAVIDGAFSVEFGTLEDKTLYGILLPQTKRSALQQILFACGWACRSDDQLQIFALPDVPETIGPEVTYTGVKISRASAVTKVIVHAHTYSEDPQGRIELGGLTYSDAETIYTVESSDITANTKENVVEVKNATLISDSIGQSTAQRIFDYHGRRNTHKSKIVYSGQKPGDCVSQPTPWDTVEVGNITTLNVIISDTVAAEVESLGVEA